MLIKNIGILGLVNNGNTCYLNSTLQLLSHISELVTIFLKNNDSYNEIEKYLHELIINKWKTDNKLYNPLDIYKYILKSHNNIKYGSQEDSREVLTYILTDINEKFNKLINNNFDSCIECIECNNISITNDNIPIIPLSIQDNINNSLEFFFKEEKLEDLVHCNKCNKKQNVKKKYKINNLSNNLIINLKRFENRNNNYIKNKKKISFDNILKIENNKYELRGFIVHEGNINSGHYYFIGKNLINKWCIYNDSSCIKQDINLKDYFHSIYILFYEKYN